MGPGTLKKGNKGKRKRKEEGQNFAFYLPRFKFIHLLTMVIWKQIGSSIISIQTDVEGQGHGFP